MTKRETRPSAPGLLMPARPRVVRTTLLAGTALGFSLLIAAAAAPGRAFAADECGPLTTAGTTDSITCHAAPGDYPTGVNYVDATGHDLTVVLSNAPIASTSGTGLTVGNSAASGNVAVSGSGDISGLGKGLDAYTTDGSVAVDLTSVINAFGAGPASAVWVTAGGSGSGSIAINGSVSALAGGNAYGVNSVTGGDNTISITGGVTAVTSGATAGAAGVWAVGGGSVSVDVGGPITAQGAYAYGVRAVSTGGQSVDVSVGDVNVSATHAYALYNWYTTAIRDVSAGISAASDGAITVTAGAVTASGYAVGGIVVTGSNGPSSVTVGSVRTSGDLAGGVFVQNYGAGDVAVHSGAVTTSGMRSAGIQAASYYGSVDVSSQSVTTTGNYARGIVASSAFGDHVQVDSDYVATSGFVSFGIAANGFLSDVVVHSGTVITHGDVAYGIDAESYYGAADVTSHYVRTSGYGSRGIMARGYFGATVQSDVVKTTGPGRYNDAIKAYSKAGDVVITSGYASTQGDYRSNAINALSGIGDVRITSGVAKTEGDYSAAILARSLFKNVYVTSDHVETAGYSSTGIFAETIQHVGIDSQYVKTSGDYSYGITAIGLGLNRVFLPYGGSVVYGGYVGADVTSGTVITSGDKSTGIFAISAYGSAQIDSDYVKTSGAYSSGIYANAAYGDEIHSNTVITAGDHSTGIFATSTWNAPVVYSGDVTTSGAYSSGIVAVGYVGAAVASTGTVTTSGHDSAGISVASLANGLYYTGAVIVESNRVVTSGANSAGITAFAADGYIDITSNSVTTTGDNSSAIVAQTQYGGDITVRSGDVVTTGLGSDGVVATGGGAVTIINAGRLDAAQGAGVRVSAAGAGTITNYGAMYGGQGTIVGAAADGLTIDNQGVIYGAAVITSAGTSVQNTGAWAAFGASQFGGDGVFDNAGAVVVTPFDTTATTTVWGGLKRFNNTGLVDQRNGHAGDVFQLAGAIWHGTGASTLAVDVSLTGQIASDKLVVGAASGTTVLAVNDLTPGQSGVLSLTGTTVVQGTSGLASNFTWGGLHKGFVDYQLSFDASSTTWNIVGLPGQAALEMLKAPTAGQSFWQRSADAWTGHQQALRDGDDKAGAQGWEVWGQVVAGGETAKGGESFSFGGSSVTPDLSLKSRWNGVQAGADYRTGKNLTAGVTAGYLNQRSDFTADRDGLDVKGFNLGGYAGWAKGRFFADGLVKADWYEVQANLRSVTPDSHTFGGYTVGARGEAGYRLNAGRGFWFEPVADLSWTSTRLLDAGFVGQDTSFSYGDAARLRASIGARAGGQWRSLRPYLGLHLGEQSGTNSMTMLTGLSQQCGAACAATVDDQKPGSFTRIDFGVSSATGRHGFNWYLSGQADVGGKTSGTNAQLGLRWRW